MKHRFYRYYILIALTLCIPIIILGICAIPNLDWRLTITILGGIFSSIYFVQKQRLEEVQLFKELFKEFNSRYDGVNESLNQILQGNNRQELTPGEINTLYDYFNLCGEEYLYYKEGYIYPEVWRAWCNGMKLFFQNKRIKGVWEKEFLTDSYYGFNPAEFMKD
jgi:hypothetical protein